MSSWLVRLQTFVVSLVVIIVSHGGFAQYDGGKRCLVRIPGSQYVCITSADVNAALELAMKPHNNLSYKDGYVEYVADVADILYDVTHILIKKFYLPPPLAAAFFPQIDTMQTNIRHICPKPFVPGAYKCYHSKYRRLDGYCMNPYQPTWNGAATAMKRFILPHFADGLAAPKVGYGGRKLPSPREVSNVIHHGTYLRHERDVNALFLHWGQFLDHDITDTPLPAYHRVAGGMEYECCNRREHHDCFPLQISPKDYFYSKWQKTCLNFIRSRPAVLYGCPLGHRTVLNGHTPTIDGSAVYGRADYQQYYLREYRLGRMKEYNPFKHLGMKGLMPQRLDNPDQRCYRENPNEYCFHAGDYRSSTQPGLGSMHHIFIRLHNWIADNLYRLNYHWGDERLYEETRRIIAAILQHVTYNEFLPVLLNKYEMDSWNLWVSPSLYTPYQWDPSWDPQVSVYFSSAAFRFAHSVMPWKMDLYTPAHKPSGWWPLRQVFQRAKFFYVPGMIDQIIHGAVNQPAEANDPHVNEELRNWLFVPPNVPYGHDLAARNIARGRDHAMPGWLSFWRFCGLKPHIYSWRDMHYVFPNDTVYKMQQLYQHIEDIDLWTGGISELRPDGGLVGPTFSCLISEQFSNIKRGDRFWYENPYLPTSFTPDQLAAIKSVTLARILCDHLDYAVKMPRWSMRLADYGKNPLLPCNANIIPRLNLAPWKEPAPPFYRGYK